MNKKKIQLWIEIIGKCNYKCYYCYNQFNVKNISERNGSLSPVLLNNILFQLSRDFEFSLITISGGEPLLSIDIEEFVKTAHKYCDNIILASNGSLISKIDINQIIKSGCTHFQISLLGSTPDVHDRFSGVNGSFKETMEGLLILKNFGVTTTLVYIWTLKNQNELLGIIEIAFLLNIKYIIVNEERQESDKYLSCTKTEILDTKRKFISKLLSVDNYADKLDVKIIIPTYIPKELLVNNEFQNIKTTFFSSQNKRIIIDSNGFVKNCVASATSIGSIHSENTLTLFNHAYNTNETNCPCKVEKRIIHTEK